MFCHKKTSVAHFDSRRKVQSSLCEKLNKMRLKSSYCDLVLVVGEHTMPVHKNILASASPFFDTMLSSSFIENTSKSVDLSDVFPLPKTLEDILDYLYTGQIVLTENNFYDMLNGASHFLLEDLRQSCSHFMFVNLSPVNVLHHWAIADMYNLGQLSDVCRYMVRARFHDMLIYQDEPALISPQCLLEMIQQGGMDFIHTRERVRFLLRWIDIDSGERAQIVHALLQNPVVTQKLGLADGELPESLYKAPGFNVTRFLQSMLLDPRFVTPTLDDAVDEALVGWEYKGTRADETRVLTVCAYVPRMNRWYTVTKLRVTHHFGRLIGFVDNLALFKSQQGFVVVDLIDNTFERVALPGLQRTSGIRSHCVFICKGEVFCILEISQYIRRDLPNGSAFMYPEAKAFMKVYSFERRSWSKVCDLPVPKQIAWLPLQFHVIQRDDCSCCYILAMSMANSYQIRGQRDQWRINGPYLLAVRKRRTKYTVMRLPDPPVNRGDVILGDTYNMLRFVGKENKLYMYGGTYDHTMQHVEQCKGILMYDLCTGQWDTEVRSQTSVFPIDDLNHVKGLPTSRIQIGNVVVGGVQSFKHGNLYHMNVPCPFISQFWAADIETGEVRELTPPPTEKLRDFSACCVPRVVLDAASMHYSQRFDRKYKNPMLHGHLAGHDKFWSCTFGSRSCTLRSESSSDCSDIDVEG